MKISKMDQFLDIEREKTVLIFDFNNLAYRTLHVAFKEDESDTEFIYWKYLVVNSILTALKKFKPNRVVLAIDSKKPWRKKIYSAYKEHRKELKEKSKIDYEKFYKVVDNFIGSFKETFSNIYCIKVDDAEADDIIAILSKYEMVDYKKIIISGDSDFNQLLSTKNVKLYNPREMKFVECLNPKLLLEIKILTGDKSDNIYPIKKRVGDVTARKILNQGLDNYLQSENLNDKYKINRQLIDFNYIPKEISDKIKNEFNSYNIDKISSSKIMMWFGSNKMRRFNEDIQMYFKLLKELI
jgi:5'-3' exonuclease